MTNSPKKYSSPAFTKRDMRYKISNCAVKGVTYDTHELHNENRTVTVRRDHNGKWKILFADHNTGVRESIDCLGIIHRLATRDLNWTAATKKHKNGRSISCVRIWDAKRVARILFHEGWTECNPRAFVNFNRTRGGAA
jgi:hypothetical protein